MLLCPKLLRRTRAARAMFNNTLVDKLNERYLKSGTIGNFARQPMDMNDHLLAPNTDILKEQ